MTVTLGVLILGGVGVVISMYSVYNNVSDNPISAFEKEQPSGQETPKPTVVVPGASGEPNNVYEKANGIVNILLLGTDLNAQRAQEGRNARTDVMILCSMNMNKGKEDALMYSIPRDTKAHFPNKLDPKTGSILSYKTGKINGAYTAGGKTYGADNAMRAISDLLSCDGKYQVPIEQYICIDLDGIPNLADAVGGVEVVLDRDLLNVGGTRKDEVPIDIGKKGEKVLITSQNANAYLSDRKNSGNDPGRATRQLTFLVEFAKKVQGMIKTEGAVNVATRLFNDVMTFAQSNITLEQTIALSTFLKDYDISKLKYQIMEGTYAGKPYYYFLPDMTKLSSFVLDHFYDPATGEPLSSSK